MAESTRLGPTTMAAPCSSYHERHILGVHAPSVRGVYFSLLRVEGLQLVTFQF